MKKVKLIALTLAAALMFSGCSLFSVDEELVQAQVVARVNGKAITRLEVENELWRSNEFTSELLYSKGYTGKELEENSEAKDWYDEWKNNMLDQMIVDELCVQKAAGLGVSLTDEEKQQKREEASEEFESAKEQIRSEVEEEFGIADAGEDTEDTADEPEESPAPTDEASASPAAVDEAVVEAEVEKRYQELLEDAYYSPDTYFEYLCNKALAVKVADHIKGLAEVSEDEAKKWYDDSLAAQQKAMDEDPTLFAANMGKNLICTYVPEDTIAVKHVLIEYKDKDLSEVAAQLYQDGKKQEAMKLLKGEIEALMPAMQDIKGRLQAGESIDDIIAELGEDPGMASGTSAAIGYLVGESTATYLEEFKNAALKLGGAGQISDPVATYYGLHVLQNVNVYNKGVIPFEDIKENIKAALMPGKQQIKYDETVKQWQGEAGITYERNRLSNG